MSECMSFAKIPLRSIMALRNGNVCDVVLSLCEGGLDGPVMGKSVSFADLLLGGVGER